MIDPLPLVSCLCPTADHRNGLTRAIRCFQEQTYERIELIVVDDGQEDDVEDLILQINDPRIHYIREIGVPPRTFGEKRNRCAELAQGDAFVLWDDSDWHGPLRVEHQLRALEQFVVCTLSGVPVQDEMGLVWDPPPTSSILFAQTAALWREIWEASPWPTVSSGSGADLAFLHEARRHQFTRWISLGGRDLYRVIRRPEQRTRLSLRTWLPSDLEPI